MAPTRNSAAGLELYAQRLYRSTAQEQSTSPQPRRPKAAGVRRLRRPQEEKEEEKEARVLGPWAARRDSSEMIDEETEDETDDEDDEPANGGRYSPSINK